MAQGLHDCRDLRKLCRMQRDHRLIDSVIRTQEHQLFKLIDAFVLHSHILTRQPDKSTDLAWRKRQALQPSRRVTRELIGAYHQYPRWLRHTRAASEDHSEYRLQHHSERQQDDHVTNQQTTRIDVIATEVKQRKKHEGSRQASRPRRTRSRSFAKQFVETCHPVVLGNECPHKCSEKHLIEVPMYRIKDRPSQKRAACLPYPPARIKGQNRQEIGSSLQGYSVQLQSQNHGCQPLSTSQDCRWIRVINVPR